MPEAISIPGFSSGAGSGSSLRPEFVSSCVCDRALKKNSTSADTPDVTDLERDNAILRGALILAARELQKLNFGKKDSPVLKKLRAIYHDMRQPEPVSASSGASSSTAGSPA
jgi:hypothetical protein